LVNTATIITRRSSIVQRRLACSAEELIAAAHAACFSMALSGQLGQASLKADSIATTANLTLE
jgi:organic hydroperoxide reductase OsmC/OhrA